MSKQLEFPFGWNVVETLPPPESLPWDDEDEQLLAESMADLDNPNSAINKEDGYGWGV